MSGIPNDQRSIRTLAKVGGLVGKVIKIDEGARYRYDYVRLRIACRDVSRVPKIAESTLGMYLIDFGFEREILEESRPKILKSGIKVGEHDHPPPTKKSRSELTFATHQVESEVDNHKSKDKSSGKKDTGKQAVYWSPPKVDPSKKCQPKLMGHAQKAYKSFEGMDDDGGKVDIPDIIEDSDSDSESFTRKIKRLTNDEDIGQSSRQG